MNGQVNGRTDELKNGWEDE